MDFELESPFEPGSHSIGGHHGSLEIILTWNVFRFSCGDRDGRQERDDTQWLTYWTVFATISLVDFGSDKTLGYFPIYWLAKCVFLTWMFLPIVRGAERLYTYVFGPAFMRLRPVIDGTAAEVSD